jgi:hypothetical protein
MYEYQKKQAAALLIADTLTHMAIRELIDELETLAELKEREERVDQAEYMADAARGL